MSSKKLIVGNWKMNLGVHESSLYLHRLQDQLKAWRDVEVVVAPTLLAVQTLSLQANYRKLKLAAQNFYWRDHGAFTGEVSASQLRGIVQYGLVGHSERRHIFHETDKDTRAKVQAAIRNNILPILCIGETAQERADNETSAVLHDQLIGGLANITSDELSRIVIAYEPVWAVGTGLNAKPSDVQRAAKVINRQLTQLFGKKSADQVRILYGGSVSPESAADYLALPEINGLLIGGASLNQNQFLDIIKKAHKEAIKK